MYEIVLFVIVAILAGLTWTMSGYLNNWRKNHNNPDWEGFDFKSMRNDAILGGVLGVAVVVIQPISTLVGTPYDIPIITDFSSFVISVFGMWPIVGMVDKFIVGFVVGK